MLHCIAHWSFESGGVGSLVHGAVLQGRNYEASLDVWADGLRLALDDPYSDNCTLRVRKGVWSLQHLHLQAFNHQMWKNSLYKSNTLSK